MDISQITKQLQESISKADNEEALQQVRTDYLGKKGQLTELLKQLSRLPPTERSSQGAALNQLKIQATQDINNKAGLLSQQKMDAELLQDTTDISLPKYGRERGSWHPINTVRKRIENIFNSAGYETVLGPEIETDYYNFEALNFPPQHPARSLHDTFYFSDGRLLRTHTSTGQVRAMETKEPPLAIICPGKTYRCDYDATHSPMFHQLEGMLVDKDVKFTDLKGTLQQFINTFFGREMQLRFRASYFPFTEPSAEVDLLWEINSSGKKETKWLEVLGCGMVHPNVLKSGNLDPTKYNGFAFGLGIERMAMLYYGIDDLRLFYENDIRFLSQFA